MEETEVEEDGEGEVVGGPGPLGDEEVGVVGAHAGADEEEAWGGDEERKEESGVDAGGAGLPELAAGADAAGVGVDEDEAGEDEEEGDTGVADGGEAGDGGRAKGEGVHGPHVEESDPEGGEEADRGERGQTRAFEDVDHARHGTPGGENVTRNLRGLGIENEVEAVPLVFGQGEGDGAGVFFEVRDGGGAGDGEDDGRAVEEPGEGELVEGEAVLAGEVADRATGGFEAGFVFAGVEGVPGEKGDVVLGAEVEGGLGLPFGEVVFVLDGGDGDCFLSPGDLVGGDFGEADVANFAGCLEVEKGAEGVFEGNGGVDAVELVEVDAIELETTEGEFD